MKLSNEHMYEKELESKFTISLLSQSYSTIVKFGSSEHKTN